VTIPNILSIFRLVLVPVFCLVFFSGAENARAWGAVIFAVACATDVLDGYIARKFGQITKLGRILDPLADKLMGFTVIVSLAVAAIVSWWAIAVFAAKEALMGLGAFVMLRGEGDVLSSNILGKLSASLFFLVCMALMLVPQITMLLSTILIAAALGLSILAMVVYFIQFIHRRKRVKPVRRT